MKKQILTLAAIGIISLSANAYAQSDNETPTSEPYIGENEDNKIKTSPNTQETSHTRDTDKPDKNAKDKPKNQTVLDE